MESTQRKEIFEEIGDAICSLEIAAFERGEANSLETCKTAIDFASQLLSEFGETLFLFTLQEIAAGRMSEETGVKLLASATQLMRDFDDGCDN